MSFQCSTFDFYFLLYFSAHHFNVICWFAGMRHLKTITSKWKSKVQMNEMAWIIQLENNLYVVVFVDLWKVKWELCTCATSNMVVCLDFIILLIVWFVPFVWVFFEFIHKCSKSMQISDKINNPNDVWRHGSI